MTTTSLLTFLGASVALTLAPGPDNLLVLSLGLTRGRREAVLTAWGMCSGISVHTMAAALGVTALFQASPLAFRCVQIAGAGYLLVLAWKALRERRSLGQDGDPTTRLPGAALFRRGFAMNVLNPKVGLFFLAFLPQFTDPGAGPVGLQMVGLGAVFMVQALILFTLIGVAAGRVGERLLANPLVAPVLRGVAAAVMGGLGLRLLLAA